MDLPNRQITIHDEYRMVESVLSNRLHNDGIDDGTEKPGKGEAYFKSLLRERERVRELRRSKSKDICDASYLQLFGVRTAKLPYEDLDRECLRIILGSPQESNEASLRLLRSHNIRITTEDAKSLSTFLKSRNWTFFDGNRIEYTKMVHGAYWDYDDELPIVFLCCVDDEPLGLGLSVIGLCKMNTDPSSEAKYETDKWYVFEMGDGPFLFEIPKNYTEDIVDLPKFSRRPLPVWSPDTSSIEEIQRNISFCLKMLHSGTGGTSFWLMNLKDLRLLEGKILRKQFEEIHGPIPTKPKIPPKD